MVETKRHNRSRQKRWLGHILRHDSLLRITLEGQIQGKNTAALMLAAPSASVSSDLKALYKSVIIIIIIIIIEGLWETKNNACGLVT